MLLVHNSQQMRDDRLTCKTSAVSRIVVVTDVRSLNFLLLNADIMQVCTMDYHLSRCYNIAWDRLHINLECILSVFKKNTLISQTVVNL